MQTSANNNQSIVQQLRGYQGNENLLMAGQKYQYTKHEVDEFVKCAQDIHYFIENYMKIVHVDHGLIPFKTWPFQKKLIDLMVNERFVISRWPRQSGKCNLASTNIQIKLPTDTEKNELNTDSKSITIGELFENAKEAYFTGQDMRSL